MNFGMDYMGGGGFSGGSGFGNSGGFGSGGGGFGGEASQSSGGRGGGRKSYDEQTIQPCTISMILNAVPEGSSDDTGTLVLADGRKLHHVVIVGAIRGFTDNSTNTEYEIEDGTGLINVKQWVDHTDSDSKVELRKTTMKDHIYVKIVGSPKYYDGHVQLIAEFIRPLSTGNELTCHMLEVVYVGEKLKNRERSSGFGQPLIAGSTAGVGFGVVNKGVPMQKMQVTMGITEAVRNYIRIEGQRNESGANIHDCIHHFKGQYQEEVVRKAIEDLAAEGLIYSTIGEDFYQIAM